MNTTNPLSIESLMDTLHSHPVNTNQFFQAFKDQYLTPQQLRVFVKQYHYFCFQFVKELEGLLYRTPIQEMDIRIELVKTLYSELGSGSPDRAHIRQLQRLAHSVGLQAVDLNETVPIPEVTSYLHTLHGLFLESDYLTALGAELAVETTAVSEFRYLYPGLQKYGRFTSYDLEFFELHLMEEQHHSNWLMQAVRKTAKTLDKLEQIAAGAYQTTDAWLRFWNGMFRVVFEPSHQDFVCK